MRPSRILPVVLILALWFTLPGGEAAFSQAPTGARLAPPTSSPPVFAGDEPAPEPDTTYRSATLMLHAGDPAAVAAAHGLTLARPAGPAGYALVRVPDERSLAAVRAELAVDPHVDDVALDGVLHGAGKKGTTTMATTSSTPTRSNPLQWQLDAAGAPYQDGSASGVVVAVVDSGVAYTSTVEGGVYHRQATTLAKTVFTKPYDFVDGDALPLDEHQHGTFMASLIASSGVAEGSAPSVGIVPLRVLDETNTGDEVALLDALAWARSAGVSVVNLSLSFGPDYRPSAALVDAVRSLIDAKIAVVAAAGNEGRLGVDYPAALPGVLAVGATTRATTSTTAVAWYSNYGPRLDVLAPGGDTSTDSDGDGRPDGVVAETLYRNDPTRTALWYWAGTSQAAATASAAVADLVKRGANPTQARVALQSSSVAEPETGTAFLGGYGAGELRIDAARTWYDANKSGKDTDYWVTILPWLATDGTQVTPKARLTVLDKSGRAVAGVGVGAAFSGGTEAVASCTTGADGSCTVSGLASGSTAEPWVVEVGVVVASGVAVHPHAAMLWSPGFDALVDAVQADPLATGAPIGWRWSAGTDATYGKMAESVVFADLPSADYHAPRAVIVAGSLLASATVLEGGGVDLGTGLTTVPMVKLDTSTGSTWSLLSMGSGLTTVPMLRLFTLDATALGTSSAQLSAANTLDGTGLTTVPILRPVLFDGTTSFSATSSCGTTLAGTATGELLASGGWTVEGTSASSVVLSWSDVEDDDEVAIGTDVEDAVFGGTL